MAAATACGEGAEGLAGAGVAIIPAALLLIIPRLLEAIRFAALLLIILLANDGCRWILFSMFAGICCGGLAGGTTERVGTGAGIGGR